MAGAPALLALPKQLLSFFSFCEDTHIMSVVPTLLHSPLPSGINPQCGPVPSSIKMTPLFTVGELLPPFDSSFYWITNFKPSLVPVNASHAIKKQQCFADHFWSSDGGNETVCLFSPLCICHSSVFHLDLTFFDHRTQNHLQREERARFSRNITFTKAQKCYVVSITLVWL